VPINYGDADRWRGQDASFLDTEWVQEQNIRREDAVTQDVIQRCPPNSSDDFINERIKQETKKKQPCCSNEAVRTLIYDMMDTHSNGRRPVQASVLRVN
jgi:hypothetical protein